MNKLIRFLFAPSLAVLLLFIYAFAMAAATFIENDYGTLTARTMIYNAWWFEMVMVLLGINFMGNIFRYKLYKKGKFPVLLFHIAFIIILIGAGITRFTAYEGIMRIRENASSNTIISDRNFIQLRASNKQGEIITIKKEKYFSPLKNNNFSIHSDELDKNIKIDYKEFIPDASPTLIDVKNGQPIIEMVVSAGSGRETRYLKKGEIEKIGSHEHLIGFENNKEHALNIIDEGGQLKIKPTHEIGFFEMESQNAGSLAIDSLQNLNFKTLYRVGDFSFVLMSYHESAQFELASSSENPKDNDENLDDALLVNVTIGDKTEEVKLLYRQGFLPLTTSTTINNIKVTLSYGAIPLITPFKIQLNDFQLERYPGSTSPSAYASEISILDKDKETPYRIFMNNVLDYKGYRFFQASYDTDEQGTVLAVNHDQAGTWVTYIGYLLMGLGMLWTLFGANSRFSLIRSKLKKLKQKSLITILFIGLATPLFASNKTDAKVVDSLIQTQQINQQHAALFGRILVQDLDGRIKPINTLASEFLRKVSRRPYFKNSSTQFDANQTFLAMHAEPMVWVQIPLIKIDPKKGGVAYENLRENNDKLIAFNDLIASDGNYILEKYVAEANTKKPAERSEFDKEILKVDERFNILFNVFSGNYLKIFPRRNDDKKTWYSYTHDFKNFNDEDGTFAKGIIPIYFRAIAKAKESKNWADAENQLAYIQKYQQVLAKEIIPSGKKIEAELWYNQLNLYFWLFQFYWTAGLLLLILALVKIFHQKKLFNTVFDGFTFLAFLAFLVHTAYIILRWYVAEHAPWSNGYEMLTFVSWALLLFGLLFYKKSDFALPLSTLFTGTLLFVSYLDWLSPEITNLMPVLKSYWLKIHVATIISSYAPLALSALLGFMALVLMIIKNPKNKKRINGKIKELTYINEMAMTIGLFLLSIGTFLGGVWANESWGRYWAWDPKETWALISIIIYAAVLHFHFIPGLKGKFVLNVASLFAFFSIIMTSFGVNYYLTGLHSYATGDPVPIPRFVYILSAIMLMVSILAYYKNKKNKTLKS